jgi:hypothetical protein
MSNFYDTLNSYCHSKVVCQADIRDAYIKGIDEIMNLIFNEISKDAKDKMVDEAKKGEKSALLAKYDMEDYFLLNNNSFEIYNYNQVQNEEKVTFGPYRNHMLKNPYNGLEFLDNKFYKIKKILTSFEFEKILNNWASELDPEGRINIRIYDDGKIKAFWV